jgi:hypothetical protein
MEVTDRKPFFKGPRVTEKVRRRRKRETRDKRERANKQEARTRDRKVTRRGCRFPMCGCYRQRLFVEVSHLRHKGIGGNPKEDRSLPELLISVCNARHKENRISIDKGTLECRPITDGGTNGPVGWWVSVEDLMNPNFEMPGSVDGWFELAREVKPGTLEPLSFVQQEILEFLARMEF